MDIVQSPTLASDLFENVILIQADLSPVFTGRAIRQIFAGHQIPHTDLLSEAILYASEKMPLKRLIVEAFQSKKSFPFSFNTTSEEFILFSIK